MKTFELPKSARYFLCLLSITLPLAMTPFIAMAADQTITVFDNYLSPDKISINVGDTIVWTNGGSVPKIIEADATQGGCSEPGGLHVIIEPGQSYSHTFTVPTPCHYTVLDFSPPLSI
jgi:plastocyanin